MTYQFAGSAKTMTVSLLKQIMSLVDWNVVKSKDVFRQCYHYWQECIAKYEALSGEKVTDIVKIALPHQNVRGNLVQFLNVNVSDSTTWSQGHVLLINYFHCSMGVPQDTKGIYRFTVKDKKKEVNHVKKCKGKVKNQKELKKERSQKGSHIFREKSQKAKETWKTKSKRNSQWTIC